MTSSLKFPFASGLKKRQQRRIVAKSARRILGLTLKTGLPIFEPDASASSIVYAASGGGKTTCVAVPAILSMLADQSRGIIINDVKSGEIAAQIGELCMRYGRKFAVIDDSFVLGKDSPARISLNAFGSAVAAHANNSPDLLFEIESISHTLIDEPKGDAKNKYFREVPREFLEFGLLVLLAHNADLATPGGLAALIGDPDTWNGVIDLEADEGEEITRSRAKQLKELRDNDPEHYSQHYLAALAALKIFQLGAAMHEAGRAAEITHAQLLQENYIICLVQNQRNAAKLGAYYGLHFNSFMSAQLSGNCGKTDFIFDEVANTPAREMIEKVTIQRAFGARTIYIAQSRSDMQRQNGEKEIAMLEDNCAIIQWLKLSNIEEAERLSRAMGEIDNVNNNLGFNSDKNTFSSQFQTGRERLFTAEELMRLPADEQILHIDGVGFVHCKKARQNMLAPYCFEIGDNPLEGGKLPPDPRVTLPTPDGGAS